MSDRILRGDATSLGQALFRANSIAEFRAAAPLPDEAQRVIDNAVLKVGVERLTVAADIMSAGLVYSLTDPLSVMEVYWESQSKVGHAIRTMTPGARGENQLPQRTGSRIPVYATMDDFQLNIRTLRASERAGTPLDVTGIEQATRRVNESIEDATINGIDFNVAGNTAYGLLTAPNANTQAYVDTEAWTAAGHSGDDILTDVINMVSKLQADNMYGPYNLYVPSAYGLKLAQDFKTNGSLTIQQRVQELQSGGRGINVRVADRLTGDKTVLVQMTSDVVDMIVGQTPVPVSWQDGPGWNLNFAVMAFIIPRVRSDYDGQSGICIGNTT